MTGFRSKAHKEKFAQLLKDKKITQAQYDEYAKATPPSRKLPDRLKPKR